MRRLLSCLFPIAALAIAAPAWAASTTANFNIGVTQSQAIASLGLSNSSFTGGAASGTVVGAISVVMAPATPAFSGTLSLTGANASNFQIVGANLETNGVVAVGTYQINIVATQAGATSSPFVQAETITGTATTASTCPQGTAYVPAGDGCTGAQPFGSWQKRNFFTGYTGSTYVTRPPWNVAGVDYAIGYSGTLKDPTTTSPLDPAHPGCASFSGSTVTVNSTPCILSHYEFGTTSIGHCVNIHVSATSGTATFDNIHLVYGSACASTVALLNACSGGSASIVVQYSQIDDSHVSGNGEPEDICSQGPSTIVKYSSFINPNQHAVYSGSPSVTLEYNYGEGFGAAVNGAHGNWDYLSNAHATITFLDQFNTKWASTGNATTLGELANDEGNWSTTSQFNVEIGDTHVGQLWAVEGTTSASATNEILNYNYFDPTGVNFVLQATPASIGSVATKQCTGNVNLLTGARLTGPQGSGPASLTCN